MTAGHEPVVNCCYAMPIRGGLWGACQVLGIDGENADIVAFDWLGKRPPTLKQLAKAKPLVLDHHAHKSRMQRMYADGPVPSDFRTVGELPPVVSGEMKPQSYGFWSNFAFQLRLQQRWDHEVPKAEKERYRAGDHQITLGETTVRGNYSMTIGATKHATLPWPADEPVPWQVLDGAGTLSDLFYHGRDIGVIKYVASRKLITELSWYDHAQSNLDFRGASLLELRLDVSKKLSVRIDQELTDLTLNGHGKGRSVSVEHAAGGEELSLTLFQPVDQLFPPAVKGLERLSQLEVSWLKVIDLKAIAKAYPKLRSLLVRGKFARVEHPEALAKLSELESLTFYDVYDLDVAALPPIEKLPKLNHVLFGGLRKSDAQLLRKHFGKLRYLDIHGAKNDAWIAANANNPLRNWVDDDEAFGEKACKIFAAAYRGATKAKGAEAKKVLTDYIKALNKLDSKYECIDTIRREEAYEAYHQLVALTDVSEKDADEWWGELCDF
ncbi:MAG: hypothetical protein H6718_21265 [Polyangiaceae bacterium]|nr:hypothetical protein [Polyangiaceae bacterium]